VDDTGPGVGVVVAGRDVALGKVGGGATGTTHPFRNTSEATIAMQRYEKRPGFILTFLLIG